MASTVNQAGKGALGLGLLLAVAFGGCSRVEAPSSPVFTPEAWKGLPSIVSDSSLHALPGRVLAVDLDLDRDLDLAVVGPNRTCWFENMDGEGSSFQAHPIDDAGCANALLVLDEDRDGWPDLVSAAGSGPEGRTMPGLLHVWRNPGPDKEAWTREVLDPVPANFLHDILAVDLDGDGWEEVVAPRGAAYIRDRDPDGNRIMVYKREDGPGPTGWQRIVLKSDGREIQPLDWSLTAADINGDGFPDLVQYQKVYLNPRGRLEESWPGSAWTGEVHPSNLIAADMDGDGTVDLAFSEGHAHRVGASRVGVWLNRTGKGGSRIEGFLEILGKVPEDPENLAVADLDHNGIPDLVTGAMNWRLAPGSLEQPAWNDEDATLVIFAGQEKQDGSRTWIECRVREGIAALHHLSLADLDRDGDLDVLGENTGAKPPPAPVTPSIQILWNRTP